MLIMLPISLSFLSLPVPVDQVLTTTHVLDKPRSRVDDGSNIIGRTVCYLAERNFYYQKVGGGISQGDESHSLRSEERLPGSHFSGVFLCTCEPTAGKRQS
ncbi:hypothetical protein IW261DRAFT_305548 [Armillaria novae-zelandiae]|uniref:Secreted protein n=1 Tax=Armillaria novae-zelandiae TaxID=153914 RepID=A0AA39P3V2_9AGAR|nr:hypothetical protein IW261DRAFT_305548 [Armillaria novae-zelandiae]